MVTKSTKKELIKAVQQELKDNGVVLTQNQIDSTIQALTNFITAKVHNGESVGLDRLGSFAPITKKSREYHNFQTNKKAIAPDKKAVKFLPSGYFRDLLEGHFDKAKDQ